MTDNQNAPASKTASLITKILIGIIFAIIAAIVGLYAFSEIARVNVTPEQKLVKTAAIEANQELYGCIMSGACANGDYKDAFVESKQQYPALTFKAKREKDGTFNFRYVSTVTAKSGYHCTAYSNTDVSCGS